MDKRTKSSGNVFSDIGFQTFEAENLKMRSELMIQIEIYILKNQLTQIEAARVLHLDQPRLSKLLNGRVDLFTVDKLIQILSYVNVNVQLKIAA
jgi:predicted XRE-type DNA-binding protein